MAGSADDAALASAMANLDVDPQAKVLEVDQGTELARQADSESERREEQGGAVAGDPEKDSAVEEEGSDGDEREKENGEGSLKNKGEGNDGSLKNKEEKNEEEEEEEANGSVESKEGCGSVDGLEEGGGSVAASAVESEAGSSGKDGEDRSKDGSEVDAAAKLRQGAESDVQVVSAAALMEKLNIAESSDGGSNGGGDDDLSSSMDSTANSGPRLVEGAADSASVEDKVASSEDCSEEGSVRPKKRIDLQHQFVRGIVKIQHDRDQYEKQCQTKKQEEKRSDRARPDSSSRRTSSSRSSPRSPTLQSSKRQFSSVDTPPSRSGLKNEEQPGGGSKPDQAKPDRTAAIYRPPSLRNADADPSRSHRTHEADATRSVRNSEADTSRINRSNIEADTARSSAGSTLTNAVKAGQGSPVKPLIHTKELDKDVLPENFGIRVTFDTEKQKRRIQLSKPSGSSQENNFVVTFDTTRRERHIEVPSSGRGKGSNDLIFGDGFKRRDIGGDLPASFEFKATAFGKNPSETRPVPEEDGRRSGRNRSRGFRGSPSIRAIEGSGAAARPGRGGGAAGSNVLEVNSKRSEEVPPPLPPKDKPFAAELKWGDMVESETEPSPVPEMPEMENSFGSSPTAPDILESNQQQQYNQSSSGGRKSSSRKNRQKKHSPPPRQPQQIEAPSPTSEAAPRRSVWERLGPRPAAETSRLRTVQYENNAVASSLESFREAAERDYFLKGEAAPPMQAAYKDAKQKRSRLELYVPRRGGSQA